MILCRNIRYLRDNAALSAAAFASAVGMTETDLAAIERGEQQAPASILLPLAEISGVSVKNLLLRDLEMQSEKLRRFECRLLALDVDGVLTDGGMYYSEKGDELKKFNTRDGLALIRMAEAGIPVGLISSGTNETIIRRRAAQLRIPLVCTGTWTKNEALENWCRELKIPLEQAAYIGDDLNDLPVISLAGLTACPSDASAAVKDAVDLVLSAKGGDGCVREFCERFILKLDS